MKKKIVIFLIITAVVISAGIGAYAAAEKAAYRQKVERSADLLNTAITEVTQNHSVTESGVRGMLVDDTSQFDLASYLRGKGYYEDEVVTILQKYIDATTLYGLTQAESDYLVSLCDLGYDFEKLLDIYQFLQITQDRDIALVKPMYEAARGTFDSKFWLENAYSLIKGWDENALSMEEIMKYTDQGIGIEEIVYAF